jgi:chitinase
MYGLSSPDADKIIGYFGSWAKYRCGSGRCTVDDIDPTLFTHIIYSFLGLNSDNTIKVLDDYGEINKFRKKIIHHRNKVF